MTHNLFIIFLVSMFQWSLRSNLTPDSKDTCSSCWREKESDDLMMMSSDSGITSPNSHHYDQQSVSPCSISVMPDLLNFMMIRICTFPFLTQFSTVFSSWISYRLMICALTLRRCLRDHFIMKTISRASSK